MRIVFRSFFSVMLLLAVTSLMRADDANQARAVIDKAIRASGGEAKLSKFKAATWKAKGTLSMMGTEVEFKGDWALQASEQARDIVTVALDGMMFKIVRVCDS